MEKQTSLGTTGSENVASGTKPAMQKLILAIEEIAVARTRAAAENSDGGSSGRSDNND